MTQVELKITFSNLPEYNEFCAANGINLPAGNLLAGSAAESSMIEYDPVADGSVDQAELTPETPAPATTGRTRGRPAKDAAKDEPKVADAAKDEPKADATAPAPGAKNLEDVRMAMTALSKAKGIPAVKEILEKHNVATAGALTEDQFESFVADCEAAALM